MMQTKRRLLMIGASLLALLLGFTVDLATIAPTQAAQTTNKSVTYHRRSRQSTTRKAKKGVAVAQGVKVWVNTDSGVYHLPGALVWRDEARPIYNRSAGARRGRPGGSELAVVERVG